MIKRFLNWLLEPWVPERERCRPNFFKRCGDDCEICNESKPTEPRLPSTADVVRAKKAMRLLINEVCDKHERNVALDAWDQQPWI